MPINTRRAGAAPARPQAQARALLLLLLLVVAALAPQHAGAADVISASRLESCVLDGAVVSRSHCTACAPS